MASLQRNTDLNLHPRLVIQAKLTVSPHHIRRFDFLDMDAANVSSRDENKGISNELTKKRLRDRIEVEELQLLNEKLQRRYQIIQEESLREKEKSSQLILLLEKQNEELRHANATALESYYTEKSALRKRVLQLENEIENLREGTPLITGRLTVCISSRH